MITLEILLGMLHSLKLNWISPSAEHAGIYTINSCPLSLSRPSTIRLFPFVLYFNGLHCFCLNTVSTRYCYLIQTVFI